MNGGSCTVITRSEIRNPETNADEQARQDARGQAPAALDQQAARDDARQSDDGARRQIDPARDDDDRGADRRDAVDRRVLQDEERVRAVQERVVTAAALGPEVPAEEHDLEQENRQRARLAHAQQPARGDSRRAPHGCRRELHHRFLVGLIGRQLALDSSLRASRRSGGREPGSPAGRSTRRGRRPRRRPCCARSRGSRPWRPRRRPWSARRAGTRAG